MRGRGWLAICLALLLFAPPAAAKKFGQLASPVEVKLDHTDVQAPIGETFGFRTQITNLSARPVSGLVAHLNVVGLDADIYVDPEDWSEDRTRFLPELAPRATTTVDWNVKAVTGGDAAIYVTALTPRTAPAVSDAMDVHIAESTDFNTDGVLPLALGIPVLLGVAVLAARRRRNA